MLGESTSHSSLQVFGPFHRFARFEVAGAAQHVKADENLLKRHAAALAPATLRFQRFTPCVAIGRHQVREREARLSYCRENEIAVERRITAGGALYLDEGQFCFSLTVESAVLGRNVGERLACAAAILSSALHKIGVESSFKAPNDLQITTRQKIASVFLAERGSSTQVFGVVVERLDLKSAMQALLVPTEKLTVTGLEHARERLASLEELLGADLDPSALQIALVDAVSDHLGIALDGTESVAEDLPHVSLLPTVPDLWSLEGGRFETKDKVEAATLRLLLGIGSDGVIDHVRFATDAHVSPDTLFLDLALFLTGLSAASATTACRAWLERHRFESAGLAASDVERLVERAIAKWHLQAELGLSAEQASGLMLAGPGQDPGQVLANASVMLVPYCAKPNWCKWRHTIDCVECGKCEVGDAYMMARERNMDVITITNFEHLSDTLAKMKDAGVQSYVGMCCGEFFLKRHHAFRNSGMDAVLLDIEGATCYELKEENLAYAGAFKAEATLDLDAVKRMMAKVPVGDVKNRSCVTGLSNRPGDKGPAAVSGCGNCGCKAQVTNGTPAP